MSSGDNPYGWGVFGIPMSRRLRGKGRPAPSGNRMVDLARALTHDPFGQALILTVPFLCLALLVVSLSDRLPAPAAHPKPVPVDVSVAIPPDVPERPSPRPAAPPAVVRVRPAPAPKPLPAPSQPAASKHAPLSRPKPVLHPAPVRPKVAPAVRRAEQREVVLPPPSRMGLARRGHAVEPPPVPTDRNVEVGARPDAQVPVGPSRSTFTAAPRPAASALPEEETDLGSETHRSDIDVQPAMRTLHDRISAGESLPRQKAPVLNRRVEPDTALADVPPSGIRSGGSRRFAVAAPGTIRRENLQTGSGEGEEVPPPQTQSMPANRGVQANDPSLPPARGGEVVFAGSPGGQALPSASSAPAGAAGSGARLKGRDSSMRASLPNGGSGSVDFARAGSGPALGSPEVASGTPSRPAGARVKATATPGGSFDFLDGVAAGDLDRSVRVNLSQLHTCLDPESEMNLKTRLAGLLSRPALCRSNGVVFDIRSPESAYSIQVDFYNYEKRVFKDRCAALRTALEACEARR